MKKRNPYKTSQQEALLKYFQKNEHNFLTVKNLLKGLLEQEINIGQTTAYRFLERQAENGSVIKIQPADGSGTQYWRLPCPQADQRGKLVCLKCRKVIPLSCEHLDMFSEHVLEKHKFNLSLQYSILYGYCDECEVGRVGGSKMLAEK